MEHEHTPEAIGRRLDKGPDTSYLRDWVYGGIDGAVTTFAVVTGVVGAELAPTIVVILGVANLLGDGFSMAASNYTGTRAEQDEHAYLEAVERRHVLLVPDGEREEVRQIYARKGFTDQDLERAVHVITSDEDRWVSTMLTEEYGLPLAVRSPLLAALNTFSAFLLCGVVPLIPYALGLPSAFVLSTATTSLVFFAIGSAKSKWSVMSWWGSGLETLLVGSGAAGLAYLAGHLVAGLVRA